VGSEQSVADCSIVYCNDLTWVGFVSFPSFRETLWLVHSKCLSCTSINNSLFSVIAFCYSDQFQSSISSSSILKLIANDAKLSIYLRHLMLFRNNLRQNDSINNQFNRPKSPNVIALMHKAQCTMQNASELLSSVRSYSRNRSEYMKRWLKELNEFHNS
jgi:hypothetical protein